MWFTIYIQEKSYLSYTLDDCITNLNSLKSLSYPLWNAAGKGNVYVINWICGNLSSIVGAWKNSGRSFRTENE